MGRRGSSEGSIHHRSSDGRWVATLSLGYQRGKRQRRSLLRPNTGRGRSEAPAGAEDAGRRGCPDRRAADRGDVA